MPDMAVVATLRHPFEPNSYVEFHLWPGFEDDDVGITVSEGYVEQGDDCFSIEDFRKVVQEIFPEGVEPKPTPPTAEEEAIRATVLTLLASDGVSYDSYDEISDYDRQNYRNNAEALIKAGLLKVEQG